MKTITSVSKSVFYGAGILGVLLAFQNCGGSYQEQGDYSSTSGSTQLPSTTVTSLPTKVPLKVDCSKATEGYAADSSVTQLAWHANKGTAAAPILVEGSFGFDAILYKETTATDYSVKLRFDMASLNSGVDLRNQRIRDIVFGSATGQQLEYAAVISASKMRSLSSLAVGQSATLTLNGNVGLWGQTVSLKVPLTVVKSANGYQVKSSSGFAVNLISALGLQSQVTQLSTICGAIAQDAVPVEFSFNMAKVCP